MSVGSTPEGGQCIVSVVTGSDGQMYLCVVMNSVEEGGVNYAYRDIVSVFKYCLENRIKSAEGNVLKSAELVGQEYYAQGGGDSGNKPGPYPAKLNDGVHSANRAYHHTAKVKDSRKGAKIHNNKSKT